MQVYCFTCSLRYDLVDLTRQVLSKRANELYTNILAAYGSRKVENVQRFGNSLLELFSDIDKLLASCEGFLLGPWLESAKNLSTNPEEKILVSNRLTGPNPASFDLLSALIS